MKRIALIAGVSMFATSAFAAPVSLTFNGVNPGLAVTYQTSGSLASLGSAMTLAGLFNWDNNASPGTGSDLFAFCIEMTQSLSAVNPHLFDSTSDVASLPMSVGGMGLEAAGQLGRLFFQVFGETNAITAYTLTGLNGFTPTQTYAGIQLAVWEIVLDSGFDVTAGELSFAAGDADVNAARMLANSLLTSVNSPGSQRGTLGFGSIIDQDQVTITPDVTIVIVPLPTAALAGLALVGALAARRYSSLRTA